MLKMKKELLIVILLIIFISGCTTITDPIADIGTVKIIDICDHPNDHIGKEVTIKGYFYMYYSFGYSGAITQYENDHPLSLLINSFGDVNTSVLYEGGEYKFTGIIGIDGTGMEAIYYMNVTKISW